MVSFQAAYTLPSCGSCRVVNHTDVSAPCVFQHALRLIAFGQLYKVLNMDPLPANKASPRLLEGLQVSSLFSVDLVFQLFFCDGDVWVCFCSAGSCQKRLRNDSGCEDRDFSKRIKGDLRDSAGSTGLLSL